MERIALKNLTVLNMPVLEIDIGIVDNVKGYLSPFRYYKFQVSETKAGEVDLGSSAIVGLKHFTDIIPSTGIGYDHNQDPCKEGLKALASSALMQFITYPSVANKIDMSVIDVIIHSNEFDEFIDRVIIDLKSIDK